MGLDNQHRPSPLDKTRTRDRVEEGDVISIFGMGERRRVNFARQIISEHLSAKRITTIDLSKINDPGFYLKLEQRKQQLAKSECMERQKMEDRLKVALNAQEWFDKPVQVLSLEERAKMLLILDLSEQPDAVIVNRPTLIKQFNRKLRALKQVFRRTVVLTETVKSARLEETSNCFAHLNSNHENVILCYKNR
jgi:hypothetical protein